MGSYNPIYYHLLATCLHHLFICTTDLRYQYQVTLTYCISPVTAIDCGTLPHPANGRVSHTTGTTFGQAATYSCDRGYNLVGDSTHRCQATGVWSGSAPTCQCMYVDIEYYKSLKMVIYLGHFVGTRLRYS